MSLEPPPPRGRIFADVLAGDSHEGVVDHDGFDGGALAEGGDDLDVLHCSRLEHADHRVGDE